MITITIAVIVFVLLFILALLASLIAIALKVVGRNNNYTTIPTPTGAPAPVRTPNPPYMWWTKQRGYTTGAVALYLIAVTAYLFLPSHTLAVQSAIWLFALLALVMVTFLPFWPGASIFFGVITCVGIMLSGTGTDVHWSAPRAGATVQSQSAPPPPTSAKAVITGESGSRPFDRLIHSQRGWPISIKVEPKWANAKLKLPHVKGPIVVGAGHEDDDIDTGQIVAVEDQPWFVRTDEQTTVTVVVSWQ